MTTFEHDPRPATLAALQDAMKRYLAGELTQVRR